MKNKEFDNKIKSMQDNLQIKGKVYFYIRVSTSGQNEDSQFLEIENFCKKNNLDVKDERGIETYKTFIDKWEDGMIFIVAW